MTRMFPHIKETWNPVVGCVHDCIYCWSRRLAKRQKHRCKLCYEFKPHLHKERLGKKWRKPKTIFVVDMGDLFCKDIPSKWILEVLDNIAANPHCKFLLLTKNPGRYFEFIDHFSNNIVLGTTIETNRGHLIEKVSKAPKTAIRYMDMSELPWDQKFIAIEPIMDFDLDVLLGWITEINPILVSIGYDNYKNYLNEPPKSKTLELINQIKNNGIEVELKTVRPAWWEKNGNKVKRR